MCAKTVLKSPEPLGASRPVALIKGMLSNGVKESSTFLIQGVKLGLHLPVVTNI